MTKSIEQKYSALTETNRRCIDALVSALASNQTNEPAPGTVYPIDTEKLYKALLATGESESSGEMAARIAEVMNEAYKVGLNDGCALGKAARS